MDTEHNTQDSEVETNSKSINDERSTFFIPGAIVLAGMIIAGAIVWTNNPQPGGQQAAVQGGDFGNNLSETAKKVQPIDAEDHIRGNPEAPIAIIEFSDFECPFCSRFHPTVKQIIEDFPDVKWVYRHFPLTSIHSRALAAAVASECAAELGGNEAFWQFADGLFENQQRLGTALYTELAGELGLPAEAFTACLDAEKHAKKVEADLQDAIDTGARGTPFSVIITEDGDVFPFSGALPYEQVKSLIEAALES